MNGDVAITGLPMSLSPWSTVASVKIETVDKWQPFTVAYTSALLSGPRSGVRHHGQHPWIPRSLPTNVSVRPLSLSTRTRSSQPWKSPFRALSLPLRTVQPVICYFRFSMASERTRPKPCRAAPLGDRYAELRLLLVCQLRSFPNLAQARSQLR